MINLAFADDQLLFRKAMISLLSSFSNVRVCIEADNGKELLDAMAACNEPIHITLLDITMPVMNGIDTLRQLRKHHPEIKNIVLTVHEEDKFIYKLIEEGANAYIAKSATPGEVEKVIKAVTENDYYFNEKHMSVIRSFRPAKGQKNDLQNVENLTKREMEILLCICQELTSPEMAEKFFISESTVNGHRNNLLAKTGARNTAGLVLFAIRKGLFDVDL